MKSSSKVWTVRYINILANSNTIQIKKICGSHFSCQILPPNFCHPCFVVKFLWFNVYHFTTWAVPMKNSAITEKCELGKSQQCTLVVYNLHIERGRNILKDWYTQWSRFLDCVNDMKFFKLMYLQGLTKEKW